MGRRVDIRTTRGKSLNSGRTGNETVQQWLLRLIADPAQTSKGKIVLETITRQLQMSSFAAAQQVAVAAGVNEATVTRTAQAAGFAGWPALRQELRARYLVTLSAADVELVHRGDSELRLEASLRRDLSALSALPQWLDMQAALALVDAIATARRTVVAASGTYAAVGLLLAHNASLAGYDVETESDPARIANRVSRLGPDDVLVTISFWRIYSSAVAAARSARRLGVQVFLIGDSGTSDLAAVADHLLLVPAEGATFAPSMTTAVALVQAVVTQLATYDPSRTEDSVRRADREWGAFRLMHVKPASAQRSPRQPRSANAKGRN